MMTVDEFLERFFKKPYGISENEPDEKKPVAVFCHAQEEFCAVMDWLMENAGMTLEDDSEDEPDYAKEVYFDGKVDAYNGVTFCGEGKYFDFYHKNAPTVVHLTPEQFFAIVGENSTFEALQLHSSPLNVLFGKQVEE